ncbi:DUF3592 domain-containing protein [Corynebacterium incognita]|uniref:DUF3592 domain-containing protein n=1 Tax=Corynebacterium incognita TaxID=2754725 RepID=A0A7G7CMQ6_9CORY|nr:DUF3592 domain-containing protein [Corynebacterium incognita]QNE88872.1 DUF3592 domain-containing protein [Corynebacterium incognita]
MPKRVSRPQAPNYTPEVLRRRLHQVIMALYAAAVIGSVAMVVGPYLNDRAINADTGRALATVTNVGLLRTTVDFQDEDSFYHSPPTGLLYPTGLGEGQQVWVNYSKENPDLVKVEGREWTLSVIPALSVWVVSTLVAGLAWVLVSQWAARAERR